MGKTKKELNDPAITENAETVLKERYLIKDKKGIPVESPKDLFLRVASFIANIEKKYDTSESEIKIISDEFYNLMAQGWFLPNSPTLMNAGRKNAMLSACFVLPVGDSIDDIFSSIKNTALIQKAGGGTGFSFSQLRPSGDIVNSSGTTTSGPLPFIKVFSEATNAIQQGAFRRGANMGMMRIDHPDIISFITIKEDLKELTNFNLSVSMTNTFMNQLQKDPTEKHIFINPRTKEPFPVKKENGEEWNVGEIFDLIIKHSWKTGEPGIIFIDKINEKNPMIEMGEIEATNPCGEQPLMAFESCNLGSINLKKFVQKTKDGNFFNFEKFKDVIHLSTRFLDNVIDANHYPIPEIEEVSTGTRKIGLGIMGFADALYLLGIPYNSEEGISFGTKIMKFLTDESHDQSKLLAQKRGCFPNWNKSTWAKKNIKIRNACTTTVAPTGTISIIANCSGGVEPAFSLAFQRNILNGKTLTEVNGIFKEKLIEEGLYSEELLQEVMEKGSIQDIESIPDSLKKVFLTARDIPPKDHIRMQAAYQENCDSSISKTINLPYDATEADIIDTFLLAYNLNCKGVTVYRDGCRNNQPMALKKKADAKVPEEKKGIKNAKPVALPDIMAAIRVRQITPFGNMHIKIVYDTNNKREREVFAQLGKGGELASSDLEAICRMISMFLRVNGSLEDVIKQLDGIGTSMSIPTKDGRIMSLADGLAKGLKKYLSAKKSLGFESLVLGDYDDIKNDKKTSSRPDQQSLFGLKCPECSSQLCFEEGCTKCYGCGYSQC